MKKDQRLLRIGVLGCGPIAQIAHFAQRSGKIDMRSRKRWDQTRHRAQPIRVRDALTKSGWLLLS